MEVAANGVARDLKGPGSWLEQGRQSRGGIQEGRCLEVTSRTDRCLKVASRTGRCLKVASRNGRCLEVASKNWACSLKMTSRNRPLLRGGLQEWTTVKR